MTNVRILLRRDTAENWSNLNPVLRIGEPGVDITNNKLKIGDGVHAWNNLGYFDDQETVLGNHAGHIAPATTGLYDIGTDVKRWRSVYTDNLTVTENTVSIGSSTVTVANDQISVNDIVLASENYVTAAVADFITIESVPDVSNFITIDSVPTDLSQLTDTTNLLGTAGNTGDVTFVTNQVIGVNNSLVLKAEPDNEWNSLYGLELFNSIDNDTHLRPLDRSKGVALGFAYGTGSHVRVEGTNGQWAQPGNGDRVGIVAYDGASASAEWLFNNNGCITFPDGTNQTTAYQLVTAPAHSVGSQGDTAGQFAVDNSYFYYCTGNYNGSGHQVADVHPPEGSGVPWQYTWVGTPPDVQALLALGDLTNYVVTQSTHPENPVTVLSMVDLGGSLGIEVSGELFFDEANTLTFTSPDYAAPTDIWVRTAWSNTSW